MSGFPRLGYPAGFIGATAPSRYAGGTLTGAPGTGTFQKGDYVIAHDGVLWFCTVAGSPGTWVALAGIAGNFVQFAPAATGVAATDTANIVAAFAALPFGMGRVMLQSTLNGIPYTLNAKLLIPQHSELVGQGKYVTKIVHAYNGDFCDLPNSSRIADLQIDGQGATFTGSGILFSGSNGKQILDNVSIINFDGPCLDFAVGAGSGFNAAGLEAYRINAASGTARYAIVISATQQLTAVPRSFSQLETGGQCAIDFGGCNNVFVVASTIADVKYTADTRGAHISASRILNQLALTVDGHNNTIVGCDVLPQITIAANADNITIGPNSYNNLPVINNSANNRNRIIVLGSPVGRRFATGQYYTWDDASTVSTSVMTAGLGLLRPFTVDIMPNAGFDQVSLEVTAVAPGSTVDLAVYSDDGQGRPGALLFDWGPIDTHTANGVITLAIAAFFPYPGRYWLGALALGGTPTVRSCGPATFSDLGFTSGAASNPANWSLGALAAWPANFVNAPGAGIGQGGQFPRVMLRCA